MRDKKHIDRLFQEGFKDFEATPTDAVWKNIEAKLNQKKKKRRVIPIWWRYAGVAALLLLLLTVGGTYFNVTDSTQQNNDIPQNQVVETENTTYEKVNFDGTNPTNDSEKTENVITDNPKTQNNLNNASETKLEVPSNIITPSKESSIAESASSKNENESKANFPSNTILNSNSNNLINQKNIKNVAVISTPKNNNNFKNSPKKLQNKIAVAVSDDETHGHTNNGVKNKASLIDTKKAKELINNPLQSNTIAEAEKETPEKTIVESKASPDNTLTIEEAIDENKDVLVEETNQNRWRVVPNAAPVYFNTLGEGSSIDPQFNNNSKSGELNMSYGISASYAINKKLKVRSGINKVNLGYNTNDVIVFQSSGLSSNTSALRNVNGNGASDSVSLISAESLDSEAPESLTSSNTSINQALGYIEIPLEIQYALSNKKLGINIIGGFSSFFLNNNEIFSEGENGNRTFLGEANNINKVSYSANFGLGLNYQISKKIDLNLEPMFKYQINTFKNTSGNFTPFFIGVYTGFAIKF
ncbi:hypothetical protein GCM10023311_14110 [Flaviramulus aquimarinus]|uniref:Outer membrane protein beta-barrel domain-containing protein n=1 Tax=Flaviramulus aquimarinus TaxID=1170456 RepID=A0ABP9F228_9FLAO